MNKLEAIPVSVRNFEVPYIAKVKSSVKTVAKRKPEKSSQLAMACCGIAEVMYLNPAAQAKFF